jgi:L-ribulose-5-phosphate 4-epimerase
LTLEAIELRKEIIGTAQRCEAMDLVMYSQGNFSIRIPGTDRVLITPSGRPYTNMKPEDIVTVDLLGQKLDGMYESSSETAIHTLAYRLYPWVGACAHVEPPYLNAVYAVNKEVPNIVGNFVYLFQGKGIALGPSAKSGNVGFAEMTLKAMGDRFGVVWKNHGVFCIGKDLQTAFARCWTAEQAARVYYLALSMGVGEPDPIPLDVQAEMAEAARKLDLSRSV